MTDKINDGGQAFPSTRKRTVFQNGGYDVETVECRGMSLRDYFAGKIISGFAGSSRGVGCFDIAASDAYQLADAMLAAREVQR